LSSVPLYPPFLSSNQKPILESEAVDHVIDRTGNECQPACVIDVLNEALLVRGKPPVLGLYLDTQEAPVFEDTDNIGDAGRRSHALPNLPVEYAEGFEDASDLVRYVLFFQQIFVLIQT